MKVQRLAVLGSVVLSVACSSSTFDVAPAGDATVDSTPATDTGGTSADSSVGDSGGVDASGPDSSTTDAAPGDAPTDAPLCGTTFPTFDRGCTADENCAFGLHQTDCCGNQIAIGFNHAQKSAFDTAETAYRTACPAACGCPMGPILTDAGGSTFVTSKIGVRCVAGATGTGTCKTYVM